jgi:hypothetical protein
MDQEKTTATQDAESTQEATSANQDQDLTRRELMERLKMFGLGAAAATVVLLSTRKAAAADSI